MRDPHDQNKKPSRWDKLPDKDVKRQHHGNNHPAEIRESETTIDMEERTHSTGHRHERQQSHHDRSTGISAAKLNGKDDKYYYERKPKHVSGYMRAWDDDESLNEKPDKNGYHRDYKKRDDPRHSRCDESSKFSERGASYFVSGSGHDRRENDIDVDHHPQSSRSGGWSHYPARNTNGEESKSHSSHKEEKNHGRDVDDDGCHKDNRGGSSKDHKGYSDERERTHRHGRDVDRGRKSIRSETSRSRLSSRGKSSSSESNESSLQTSSKRKHRQRSKSRSGSSGSRSSSEERERKRKKRDKKKDRSKRKDRNKEERRSILTGKKIKLKVKKDKDDYARDANREKLLQFLNSTYE